MEEENEKIPAVQTDTIQQSLADLPGFLKRLKSVIDTFPPIIKYASWSDLSGKALRKWSKYWLGRDTVANLSTQYREVLSHYRRMLEFGEATCLALLPRKEDDTPTRAKHILLLLDNIENPGSLVKPFLDYFAACATLELIRPSILVLLKILESNGHIKPDNAFIFAFKNLEGLIPTDDSTNEPISTENSVLHDYAERSNIAKLLKLVRILSVFSTKKLPRQDNSQQGNQLNLDNGTTNAIHLKVTALREFNALFSLSYLGKLLTNFKAWEQGKNNSLQTLEMNIHHLFVLSEANLEDIPMIAVDLSDEELLVVANSIQHFMEGGISEDELPDALKSGNPTLAPIALVTNAAMTGHHLGGENDETLTQPAVIGDDLIKLISTLSTLSLDDQSDHEDLLPLPPNSNIPHGGNRPH